MADSFRQNLRLELDYQDLTVKELCAKTGIPKATLECYLGARSNMPAADIAVKIARILGVSVEYLVTGEENSPPQDYLGTEIRSLIKKYKKLKTEDRKLVQVLVERFCVSASQ